MKGSQRGSAGHRVRYGKRPTGSFLASELPAAPRIPGPRTARGLMLFALVCCSLTTVTYPPGADVARRSAVLFVCVGSLLAVQVVNSSAAVGRRPAGVRAAAFCGQALLTYGPAVAFGPVWTTMLGCLAGSALLLLRGRAGWALFAVVGASTPVFLAATGRSGLDTLRMTPMALLTGLVICGLARLPELSGALYASRAAARTAVSRERQRFARDLHDLLGYSLSSITLRAELINRLAGMHPDRVGAETEEVLRISRQALADVRLVASGYRSMSLAAEADSAASTLRAAGIRTEVDVDCGRLHPLVDTALATVLREGVTNLLRHSNARTCVVSARSDACRVRLTVVNDGAAVHGAPDSWRAGSGLGNLRARLDAVGGRLDAGMSADGTFRLTALAPLSPAGDDRPGSCPGGAAGGPDGMAGVGRGCPDDVTGQPTTVGRV